MDTVIKMQERFDIYQLKRVWYLWMYGNNLRAIAKKTGISLRTIKWLAK